MFLLLVLFERVTWESEYYALYLGSVYTYLCGV